MRAARAIWIGFFMGLFNLWMLSEVGSSVVDMVETQTPAAIRASVGPEGMYAGVADPLGEDFFGGHCADAGQGQHGPYPRRRAATLGGGRMVLCQRHHHGGTQPDRTILFAVEGRRTGPGAFSHEP